MIRNVEFSRENYIARPGVTLSASSQLGSLDVARSATPRVVEVHRLSGSSGWGRAELGGRLSIGILMARFPTETAAPLPTAGDTIRWRVWDGSTLVLDTGTVPTGVVVEDATRRLGYGSSTYIAPTAITGTAVQWDLSCPSMTSFGGMDIGHVWAGPLEELDHNWSYPLEQSWDDRGTVKEADMSGAGYADRRPRVQVWSVSMQSGTERDGEILRRMQLLSGGTDPVVMVLDRDATPRAQHVICGRMIERGAVSRSSFRVRAHQFKIRETR